MKEFAVDHEVVMEHTLSYLFGAKDIVKGVSRDFDVAFLPSWYHFYTGILQAASYRWLKNKTKTILIFEWKDDDSIFIYDKPIWPFLWKTWELDKEIKKLLKKFDFVSFDTYWIESIYSQLNYLRILFNTEQIIPIFVWSKLNKKNFIKFISTFDIVSDFNLVFISDIHILGEEEKILLKDKSTWKEKFNKHFVSDNIVFNMFSAYIKAKLMDVKVLAQTDSYQLSWNSQNFAVYLSALAK